MEQNKPKLVKSGKIVKLPRSSGSVEATLKRAMRQAKKGNWKKVVIVGDGIDERRVMNSPMKYYNAIGMLTVAIGDLREEMD